MKQLQTAYEEKLREAKVHLLKGYYVYYVIAM